jgi:hypothetical protein
MNNVTSLTHPSHSFRVYFHKVSFESFVIGNESSNVCKDNILEKLFEIF